MGREKELSAAEIAAVLGLEKIPTVSDVIPILTCPKNTVTTDNLIRQLGGTIKIGEEIGNNLYKEKLIEKIIEELKAISGKIHFGLSGYGMNIAKNFIIELGKEIKGELKEMGLSVRYVPNQEIALSSATVDHNHLLTKGKEFLVWEISPGNFSLAQTVALQPYQEFSARDYGRPGRDDLSGMLPPKLAMMMINLAGVDKDSVIYDPFCGSGTIVTEAMLMGYNNIIGSDLSEQAISDTQKNMEWIKNKYQIKGQEIKIFAADATNLGGKITPSSIDAIVAEPYLGKPLKGNEAREALEKQAGELKQLYLRSFAEFKKIVKPNGTVVFIFPCFRQGNNWITTDCEEDMKKLGYTNVGFGKNKFLLYERPGQKVGRQIWKYKLEVKKVQ